MKYTEAKRACHVRSAIYRTGNPTKIFTNSDLNKLPEALRGISSYKVGKIVPNVYWKNNKISLDDRVPEKEKKFTDWEEYDPREKPNCSAYNETPA